MSIFTILAKNGKGNLIKGLLFVENNALFPFFLCVNNRYRNSH